MDLVTPNRVRNSVHATLQSWLPYYMSQAERSDGIAVGSTPRPKSWRLTLAKDGLPNFRQTPMVVTTIPSVSGLTVADPECYNAIYTAQVNAIVRGDKYEDTAENVSIYAAAIAACLAQRRELDGSGCYHVDVNGPAVLDLNIDGNQRTVGEALVEAQVYWAAVVPRYAPIDTPPDDPADDPADPTVLTATSEYEKETG